MPLTPKTNPQPAPPFSATAHDGQEVSLASLTTEGPLVLVLLRGFS